jgi:ABC-type multidrug transport system fused ATPase/permease subunit
VLYVKAARNLKRMEAGQRSPLYQHFNETLNGAATIRAYGYQEYFVQTNYHNIDTHNRPYFFLLATTRWLGLRINFAGALVAFFATAFALINIKTINPASVGLSLSYALSFNETILWSVFLVS